MFASLDYTALLIAGGVFMLAVLVAWVLRRFQITDSIGFVTVVILPMLAYGVASGYVAKVSLPGGWAAEFRQVASAQIRPAPLAEEVESLEVIEKGGVSAIQSYRDSHVPGQPIAISLRLGRQGYYSGGAISQYIRAFLSFDPLLTVIFIDDQTDKFVASSNAVSVLAALEVQDYENSFMTALENVDLLALSRTVLLTSDFVRADTSNAEALQTMVAAGADSIIKVDDAGRAVGLVRREDTVARLMLKLAGGG